MENKEHNLQDKRCECCGYMTYQREHMSCIRAAKQAQPSAVPDVDWLAQVIRAVDGNHSLGAGALAEKIVDAMLAAAQK